MRVAVIGDLPEIPLGDGRVRARDSDGGVAIADTSWNTLPVWNAR